MSDDIIKVGAGVCLGYAISKISKKNVTNFLNSVIAYYNKKDMDKRIEKRKVVDVMGDHLGYLNNENKIVKHINVNVNMNKVRLLHES